MALHTHSAMLLAELKTSAAASSSWKGKGKSKGKDNEQHGQKRGGWSPKIAEMIVAIKQEDSATVQLVAQSYYKGSYMLQELLISTLHEASCLYEGLLCKMAAVPFFSNVLVQYPCCVLAQTEYT